MSTYSTGKAAKQLGVSVRTVQQWDRDGKLLAFRSPNNRRYYTEEQIRNYRHEAHVTKERKTIVYMRVSSQAQKPDLKNQRVRLEEFCAAQGLAVDEWVEEIGGGLNFKRPKFLKLIDQIVSANVVHIVIAHKDRLARFGFDLLRHLCASQECQLSVMNTESLSPEREMVEDLMTITHCFSSRLSGLRNYQKTLEKALHADQSA